MDDYRNEPIADRIGRDFTGAMSLYVLLLGHRLGLLRALAERRAAHGQPTWPARPGMTSATWPSGWRPWRPAATSRAMPAPGVSG